MVLPENQPFAHLILSNSKRNTLGTKSFARGNVTTQLNNLTVYQMKPNSIPLPPKKKQKQAKLKQETKRKA